LRIVAKYTIGVDDVDLEAATELGILVTHCPTEANWGGVAETTVAMMLCLLKKLRERDQQVKEAEWRDERLLSTYLGARQDGYSAITVVFFGRGRVGGRFADLLRPWKMRILAHDPYIPPEKFAQHGAEPVDLATLLQKSDVVSLHVVLTKETYHMIGKEQLALMKPTAILINTARGPAADEAALVEALRNDSIRAAALDVFEEEPLPSESPLRLLGDKVLLSPHMASSTVGGGLTEGIRWATEAALKALKGQVPDNVYNKEVIPKWLNRFGGKGAIP
jgi:phosphoglycerate dehydrogenase-like enzyme